METGKRIKTGPRLHRRRLYDVELARWGGARVSPVVSDLPDVRSVPPFEVSSERASPSREPELMDDPGCDAGELDRALDALTTINRWFGGVAAIRRPIEAALAGRAPDELRLLDVGTGAGDIPVELARRLGDRGWRPRFILADNHATILRLARDRLPLKLEQSLVQLDASRLPLPDDAVDIGMSATMIHHLETDAAAAFLREIDRVSRLGWVVSDLRRGAPLRFAFGVLTATLLWRNPTARTDGRASIRRAFTADEIRALLDRTGLDRALVRSGPVRWVALGGELAER